VSWLLTGVLIASAAAMLWCAAAELYRGTRS
jgi:hypothetical protein